MIVTFAFLLSILVPTSVSAKEPFTSINVPKANTAPVIDGKVSDGEYKLVASYDKDDPAWNRDTFGIDGKDVRMDVYATWDEEYFYFAVIVTNLDPNYTPGPNKYVFEQPSLMTGMLYDDPTLAKFAEPSGKENWDWGDAAAQSFAREWTVGTTKEGTDFMNASGYSGVNHFGAVRSHADFKASVTAM